MANPQTGNGYIRIANELWEEIIRRDFKKRQRAIIDFIYRLSYGTGKRYAIIPQLNHFELAGIGKTNIKKELKYLEGAGVLIWDQSLNRYEINKDYERWQISPTMGWDLEKFEDLLHINLKEASYQNDNSVIKTITQLSKQEQPEQDPSYQNNNRGVIKTITSTPEKSLNDAENGTLKESIKDSEEEQEELMGARVKSYQNDNSVIETRTDPRKLDQQKTREITRLLESEGFGTVGPTINEALSYWIDQGPFEQPHEIILESIRETVRNGASTWRYVDKILTTWARHNVKTLDQAAAYIAKWQQDREQKRERQQSRTGGGNRTYKPGTVRTDKLPKWMQKEAQQEKEDTQQKEPVSPEEQKWMDEYLKTL